jgi:hypothetical protein
MPNGLCLLTKHSTMRKLWQACATRVAQASKESVEAAGSRLSNEEEAAGHEEPGERIAAAGGGWVA